MRPAVLGLLIIGLTASNANAAGYEPSFAMKLFEDICARRTLEGWHTELSRLYPQVASKIAPPPRWDVPLGAEFDFPERSVKLRFSQNQVGRELVGQCAVGEAGRPQESVWSELLESYGLKAREKKDGLRQDVGFYAAGKFFTAADDYGGWIVYMPVPMGGSQ